MQPDILERLREWKGYQAGEVNNWGPELTVVLTDAIAEIEFLRSVAGAVSRGESHADIKARLAKGGDAR